MPVTQQQINAGSNIPTTIAWDISHIQESRLSRDEIKEILIRLYENMNEIALAVNNKEFAYYDRTPLINGQQFFPNPNLSATTAQRPEYRQVFRQVVNFGQLPNAGSKSVAHGLNITANTTFTRIYGASSDTTGRNYIPLPYASNTSPIQVDVDSSNITLTTLDNKTNFTTTYVILEFIQS